LGLSPVDPMSEGELGLFLLFLRLASSIGVSLSLFRRIRSIELLDRIPDN